MQRFKAMKNLARLFWIGLHNKLQGFLFTANFVLISHIGFTCNFIAHSAEFLMSLCQRRLFKNSLYREMTVCDN